VPHHSTTEVAKIAGAQIAGWALVLLGLAAMILPGPGLLLLFAGLAILSQQFAWAERRVEPVKGAAFKTASDSVQTRTRIAITMLGGALLIALGIVWGIRPGVPDWWPLRDTWWLAGGWATGSSLIISGLSVWALLVYSIRRFRD
jgi:putative transmembrane protein PGPGW